MPEIHWLHYAENLVAPLCRKRNGSIVPKIHMLLYDNLKSAVLERQGQAIRFHPALLAC